MNHKCSSSGDLGEHVTRLGEGSKRREGSKRKKGRKRKRSGRGQGRGRN